jgi:hypothetical protein
MMEIHLYFVGIPLALVLVLAALIWTQNKDVHPATYQTSEPWTHSPILWAATDENVGAAAHGDGASEFSVGGGASGTW